MASTDYGVAGTEPKEEKGWKESWESERKQKENP